MRGKRSRYLSVLAGVVVLSLFAAACSNDDDGGGGASGGGGGGGGNCAQTDSVKLQLQWFIQAQFAGYYAAQDQGFYADQCLDVTIVEGGVDIVPQQQLADGAVDFALAWVPKALATREAGANIVDIAQVFQRSGTLQVSFADAGITTPADFSGKTVGNWGFGNEYEIFAALAQANLDPATDVTLVQQDFDMSGLLSGDIDAAEAMIYNEYAQVLETVNPDTGELYQPSDLIVVS
jgi:NitT/TauT family transport system substrate-binding protein